VTAGAGAPGAPAPLRTGSGRLGTCLALSALLHGLAIAAALLVPARPAPPLTVIPVALLGPPGGGGGGRGGDASPSLGAAPPAETPAPVPLPRTPRRHPPPPRPAPTRPAPTRLAARATPAPAAVPPGPASGGSGDATGGSGGGSGGGHGTGEGSGDGAGVARVAYGENPPPPYPLIARRLGMEGLVLLEVLVAPDGRAEEVRIVRSSGHPPLDESAVSTVRSRWRFVPASRGGTPIESRVTVPIRFRLSDAG